MQANKKSSGLALFFLLAGFVYALPVYSQNMAAVIKTQAMEMARAILDKDKQTVAKYLHPDIIALAGGMTETLNRMDSANLAAKRFGASIQKIIIGHPLQIVQYKNEWQCTLPQTTTLQTSMGTIELETTLIGVSRDEGRHWYFLDTSFYGEKSIRKQLTELSAELIFPPRKPPKITPKELPTAQ